MKHFAIITGLGIFLGLLLTGWQLVTDTPVVGFLSLESKTENNGQVWNRIRFLQQDGKDIWLMKQKHETADDNLAIVVDPKQNTARFYQLQPGPLVWNGPQEAIPLQARCYACHSNGPRAIRPDYKNAPLPWSDQLVVEAWNLRVKLYGQLQSLEGFNTESGVRFQSGLSYLEKPLNLPTCLKCHSENGIRAPLKKEHLLTSAFLVKNKMMPPFPFELSEEEMALLLKESL